MKTRWGVAFGVVCGLLGAGLLYLASSPPRGEAIKLLPPPTPAPIAVHVAGAVVQPGVYNLPQGSRVLDAVEAAGGILLSANAQAVNLAAVIKDGDRISIPALAPTQPTVKTVYNPPVAGTQNAQPTLPAESGLININTATQEELDSLPGIGPVTAQKIIAYREAYGPFTTIESIQDVSGIGPATFERIKDLITV